MGSSFRSNNSRILDGFTMSMPLSTVNSQVTVFIFYRPVAAEKVGKLPGKFSWASPGRNALKTQSQSPTLWPSSLCMPRKTIK